jgi:hypothetical protein
MLGKSEAASKAGGNISEKRNGENMAKIIGENKMAA